MNQQRIAKLWERAISAEQRGDLSESKRLYRKVAVAAPTHATTFQRLGLIAVREARLEDAVKDLRRSLSIEPADPGLARAYDNLVRSRSMTVAGLALVDPIEAIAKSESRDAGA